MADTHQRTALKAIVPGADAGVNAVGEVCAIA